MVFEVAETEVISIFSETLFRELKINICQTRSNCIKFFNPNNTYSCEFLNLEFSSMFIFENECSEYLYNLINVWEGQSKFNGKLSLVTICFSLTLSYPSSCNILKTETSGFSSAQEEKMQDFATDSPQRYFRRKTNPMGELEGLEFIYEADLFMVYEVTFYILVRILLYLKLQITKFICRNQLISSLKT